MRLSPEHWENFDRKEKVRRYHGFLKRLEVAKGSERRFIKARLKELAPIVVAIKLTEE